MKNRCTMFAMVVASSILFSGTFAGAEPKMDKKDCPLSKMGDHDRGRHQNDDCDKPDAHGDACPLEKYASKARPSANIQFLFKNRDALGLTQEQIGKLATLMQDATKAKIRKKADMDLLEVDLKGVLYKTPVDIEKASVLIREVEKVKSDMAIACLTSKEQAMKVLTDDQNTKVKELLRGTMAPPSPEATH